MQITNIKDFYDDLAAFLEGRLEAIDTVTVGGVERQLHAYNIYPQIGDFTYPKKKGKIRKKELVTIKGTLIARASSLVPIQDYGLFTATSLLTLQVKEPMVDDVFDVVSELVSTYNGTIQPYADDPDTQAALYCQLTFETPTVANLEQKSGVGTSAEIRLFVSVVVYDTAVLGNSVVLSIDGEPQLPLQAAVQVLRTYEQDNVGNDQFVRNTTESRAISVTAKLAYRNTTALDALIADELDDANLDKTHTVTYSDGAGIPHTSPKTWVMTVERLTHSFAPGEIGAIDVLFLQAPGTIESEGGGGGAGTVSVQDPTTPPGIGDEPGIPA